MNDGSRCQAKEALESPTRFEDASTECAICLESLKQSRVITLACGHKWHYHCLVQQLRTAQPSSTKRLLFAGCQCAKCGMVCDHEELEDLTRTTDALRQKVDKLIHEQVALDSPEIWKQAQHESMQGNVEPVKKILDDARRKYAFFLCKNCKEPYFGGTVECADQMDVDDNQGQRQEERLCVACTPLSQKICRNPQEHAGYLTWKCRHCCQPATHLCYGNVHFCDHCHDQNSRIVRDEQQKRGYRGANPSSVRPRIKSSPCPGASCPFPKPSESQSHHTNGRSLECEQVYGCAWCRSYSEGALNSSNADEPGSYNFLTNPSGLSQLQGWRQLNPRMSWMTERAVEHLRVNSSTDSNFVSSFLPCIMSQTVDLTSFLVEGASNFHLEASARYMGRTDCPSVFRLEAVLMDRNHHRLRQLATSTLEAPPDYWARANLLFENVSLQEGAYFLTVVVIGKDSRFWQGNFGSKVADIQVRVLGNEQELSRILLSPHQPPQFVQGNHNDNDAITRGLRGCQHQNVNRRINPLEQQRQQERGQGDTRIYDHVILIVGFVILAWMLMQQ